MTLSKKRSGPSVEFRGGYAAKAAAPAAGARRSGRPSQKYALHQNMHFTKDGHLREAATSTVELF
jgi:hypothetical protein